MPASSFPSSCPAAPTNGTPCLSSWKPGASPTNIRSACGFPEPKTTCVRPCASGQRTQPATSAAKLPRSSTGAGIAMRRVYDPERTASPLVPAAAAAAAATAAAGSGLAEARRRRDAVSGEDRELLLDVRGAALGAVRRLVAADQ